MLEISSTQNTTKVATDSSINTQKLLIETLATSFPHLDNQIQQFSQSWTMIQVHLGDEIFSLSSSGNISQQNLYLVCQGRVRLLGIDPKTQKEVCTAVLEPGENFGGDRLIDENAIAYRGVAASASIIGVLPLSTFTNWWEKIPSLQTSFTATVEERQKLIFLKTRTELKTHSSHLLKQVAQHIHVISIPSGETVETVTNSQPGKYWLCQGTVTTSPEPNQVKSLHLGESWIYPSTTPSPLKAETDLRIYYLPEENQDLLHLDSPHRPLVKPPPIPTTSQTDSQQPQQQTPTLATPESNVIQFPRPQKRRQRWLQANQPFVRQQSVTDCGAACLAMICQYWGKRFSINMLRNVAEVGRSGASLKSLAAAGEKIGFQTRPVRASLGRLIGENPWIAHWQGDHYIVVYQIRGQRITVADPAIGRRVLTVAEFQAGWTGYALLLHPTAALQQIPNSQPSLNRVWSAFLPYQGLVTPILLVSVLMQIFGLVTPLFTQIILDQVVVHKALVSLHVFAIGLLMFSVWRIGLQGVRQYLLDYFSNRADLTLVSGFIAHALNLPLQFFAVRHVGDIVTRVQENHKIQMFITRQALTTGLDAGMAVVYVGLMAYYNWHLTLLVLAILPPIIILTVFASPMLRKISREIFHESAQQNSDLVEMLTGISTVKMAAAERELRWRWEDHLTSMFNAQFKGQKMANHLQIISGLINSLGSVGLLWYGANLVIHDQLSIGQFVAFNMLIGNVINPVLALVGLWDELQEVLVSVERLEDVFSAKAEESIDNPLLILPQIRGEVEFENVNFRYSSDDQRYTLQNISFCAHPGQTIAIVGRSGSGKSTLINLLQGLYHPSSGRILIDGHDIRHVSPQSLRQQLGVVPQECFLFSGTILENITLYRPEYSLEEVIKTAKLAEANTFIQNLPLGYNTKVGERGSSLSGGQRQRIAIARALLANPSILILDEATSSLDTESERRFQENLQMICRDRTTFIIAHRLSTVRNADYILVLDRGLIVERGNHEDLINLRGLYYHLAQQQLDL